MEPQEQEVEESPRMRILETFRPEAVSFLNKRAEDQFSFKDLLPRNYWEIAGQHIYFPLDLEGLSSYVGLDESAPFGAKTPCAVDVSDLVCNLAVERYPEDEKLQYLISKWTELEEAIGSDAFPRKRPSEIISIKKEFYLTVSSWSVGEIRRLHKIFSDILFSLGDRPETHFIPRYIARIHMREQDGELRGQIQKKGEKDIRGGSFAAVSVSQMTCFSRVAFTLGLQPGYHVLAGCGSADHPKSHLYALRNIRMKLKDDIHRQDRRYFERWGLLYAQTHKDADEIKSLNDADAEDSEAATLENLWFGNVPLKSAAKSPEIWVTGEELQRVLDQNDNTVRHTTRNIGLILNPHFGEREPEILLVVERGDNKSGGKANRRSGKPPGWGVPGGTKEKVETLGIAVVREFTNEAQTMNVKILAYVAEFKKKRLPDHDQDNVDHWFYSELGSEAGTSKVLIERPEIYKVYAVPLSQLAEFKFQNTRRAVWDVRRVDEERLIYPNHAHHIIRVLKRVPGLKLPENFSKFEENLKKFWDEKMSYL